MNETNREQTLTHQIAELNSKMFKISVWTMFLQMLFLSGVIVLCIKLFNVWGILPIALITTMALLYSGKVNGFDKAKRLKRRLMIERGYRYTDNGYKEYLDKDGNIIKRIEGEMVFKD